MNSAALVLLLSTITAQPSIFDVDGTWLDQNGKHVALSSMKGEPIVIAMMYASCKSACPLVVHEMKTIEAKLDDATKARVHFVLVSIDPKRDTPAVLKKRALDEGFDDRWTLLTGSDDDVRTLANVLDMKYKKAGDEFAHTALVSVVDKDGSIALQLVGTQADTAAAVELLQKLAR